MTGRLHRRLAHLALRPALAVALAVAVALLGFGAVAHVHDHSHDCDGRPVTCFWCMAAAAFVFLSAAGPVLLAVLRAPLRLPAPAAVRGWSHPVGLLPSRAPPAA